MNVPKHLQIPHEKSCADCYAVKWCVQTGLTKEDLKACQRKEPSFIEQPKGGAQ